MHIMHDQELSPKQITLLTKAMLSVAFVDGIHPAEAALIGQFHESSRNAQMPSAAELMANPECRHFDTSTLAGSSVEFADTVVLMCLMTAHADGHLSDAEKSQVDAIAKALSMDAVRLDAHLAQVRDSLVGALAHLPDAQSVANVAHELSQ